MEIKPIENMSNEQLTEYYSKCEKELEALSRDLCDYEEESFEFLSMKSKLKYLTQLMSRIDRELIMRKTKD